MKKPSFGIMLFGLIEILTLLTTILTLLRIEYYPMMLLFFPTPVAILGLFTIGLKPFARRLNLLLSPLIVLTYNLGLLIIIEFLLSCFAPKIEISKWVFYVLYFILLIVHISFFSHKKIKEQFGG